MNSNKGAIPKRERMSMNPKPQLLAFR